MQRRPELDGLRGVAALIVLLSHVSNKTGLWGGIFGRGGGQIGVMLFFVLSGYLMGMLYLDRPFRRIEVQRYVVHRGARIVPLYYLIVLLSFISVGTSGLLYGVHPQKWTSQAADLTICRACSSSNLTGLR